MARTISNTRRDGFLPDGMARFLRRRALEAAGFAILALALLIGAALATFDPSDPSFNVAVERPATNALGHPGAYLSDVLLHSLGAAAALFALVVAAWGMRLILHRPMRRAWTRLLLLPPGLLAAATALTFVPAPANWPVAGGLGGLVGRLGLGWLAGLVAPIPAWSVAPIGLALAALAACLLTMAAGLPLADLGRTAVTAARILWRGLRRAAAGLRRRKGHEADDAPLFRIHDIDDDDEDDDERAEPVPAGFDSAPASPVPAPAPPRSEPDPETTTRRRAQRARQRRLDLAPAGSFRLPPLDLLDPGKGEGSQRLSKSQLEQNGRLLECVLEDFGVKGRILGARPGPVVTLYELEPAPGTKSSRVISLADDIARSMSAISVRVAVVPGRNVIGIELPNQSRETVYLRPLFQAESWERSKAKLGLALGRDIGGEPVVADLARMPHLLVAGTTGSGKSVAINTMILSILYRHPPERCRFIMIDPKMLELSVYDQIPHLLSPVVTDPKKAVVALKWTVREMEDRYRSMSKLGVRNIDGYNQRIAEALKRGEVLKRRVQTGFDPDTGKPVFEEQPFDTEPLPYIVVVVDEMADLMLVAGKDIEGAIQRLAQMARAAGIHIIMATQRPSVDVITGTIKANFPTRISFQVTSKIDSRTILGEQGAEQLLGMGDMLYMAGGGRITRVHGPFVTDEEVEEVCAALREQGEPDYIDAVTEDDDENGDGGLGLSGAGNGESGDALYDQAVALVCRERKASTSFVQRHLQIGYNRAARLIERMEAEGVISGANHVGKREVLARNIEDNAA